MQVRQVAPLELNAAAFHIAPSTWFWLIGPSVTSEAAGIRLGTLSAGHMQRTALAGWRSPASGYPAKLAGSRRNVVTGALYH